MPDSPKHALASAGLTLPEIDFEACLADLKSPTYEDLREAFQKQAAAANDAGTESERMLYSSLQTLCSFMPNYSDVGEPYRPMMIIDGSRSAIPEDLTAEDLTIVAELYERAKHPTLRARLGDLLFLRRRDHKAALDAVSNYVITAQRLLTQEEWFRAPESFRRALQLAAVLGRDKPAWNAAAGATLTAIENPLAGTIPAYACKLLQVTIGMGVGDPLALSKIAKSHADSTTASKLFRVAREYRTLEADFLSIAKQQAEESKARILVAETYVEEAEQALLRPEPSYFVASHCLIRGVEALRQAKGDPVRIAELRARLVEYQAKSMDEMKPFEFEFDLSEPAQKAMDFVQSDSLEESIERLALGYSVVSVKELREQVLDQAKEAPLSHIMGSDIVNQHGQVQKSTGPLLGTKGEQAEKEFENRMFQAAARSTWLVRAAGFIQPARVKIWQDHPVTAPDLAYIVRHNPFIPPGHEAIFMRGLFYGFAGDFMLASHLLVPQIENSIRHILISNGVDVSNIKSDLTQPVKLMGPLLDMPETKTIFGEDLIFEFRGLLIEKTGYAFRNDLAHGFITERESYGHAAVNCWWLVLRLCLTALKVLEDRKKQGIE